MTSFRRPLSIRTRLALIYTGLLAAALVAFGTGVYVVLRDELERSFDAGLLANADHAAGAFALDVDAYGRLRPTAQPSASRSPAVALSSSDSPLSAGCFWQGAR